MLIAADTNVLMDLAASLEAVMDAIELVRTRVEGVRLVVLPTVVQELNYIAKHGAAQEEAQLAGKALQELIQWGFEPVGFLPFQPDEQEQISRNLRKEGLLPEDEVNDSLILAEAALLDCGLFVTSDHHFLALDFQLLTLEFKTADLSAPAIASPGDIVQKFYR